MKNVFFPGKAQSRPALDKEKVEGVKVNGRDLLLGFEWLAESTLALEKRNSVTALLPDERVAFEEMLKVQKFVVAHSAVTSSSSALASNDWLSFLLDLANSNKHIELSSHSVERLLEDRSKGLLMVFFKIQTVVCFTLNSLCVGSKDFFRCMHSRRVANASCLDVRRELALVAGGIEGRGSMGGVSFDSPLPLWSVELCP